MRVNEQNPPRQFKVGINNQITIRDSGTIELDADEQVTFITPSGAEYDVAAKSWGFYATPSFNGRLLSFGLRGVLVRNSYDRFYVMLVEKGKEDLFIRYLTEEEQEIVCWLDDDTNLIYLAESMKRK